MEYLFWIILIGGFGFLMMRKGGCCGGNSHGKNKSHGVSASSQDMAALNKKHSGSQ